MAIMSMPREIEVTCKDCGSKQSFTTWQTLNASLNPEAKEALLKGELTRFTCAKCGSSAEVVYPLFYHDMQRKLMIWLVVRDGDAQTEPMSIGVFMRNYQLRIVTNHNQLVEKIRIFDWGLDDRLLEFAKFILRLGATNAGRTLTGELLFNRQGKTASGEAAIQFVLLYPGGPEHFTTMMSQLDEFSRELGGKLPSAKSECAHWVAVDEHYAANLASKF